MASDKSAMSQFDRDLAESLADEEQCRRDRELIDWFMRRYPTPRERLAYIRRKTREWSRVATRVR